MDQFTVWNVGCASFLFTVLALVSIGTFKILKNLSLHHHFQKRILDDKWSFKHHLHEYTDHVAVAIATYEALGVDEDTSRRDDVDMALASIPAFAALGTLDRYYTKNLIEPLHQRISVFELPPGSAPPISPIPIDQHGHYLRALKDFREKSGKIREVLAFALLYLAPTADIRKDRIGDHKRLKGQLQGQLKDLRKDLGTIDDVYVALLRNMEKEIKVNKEGLLNAIVDSLGFFRKKQS